MRNFLINNPDLEDLDLSGSAFLEGVPEELGRMEKLKSVKFSVSTSERSFAEV